MPVPKEEWGTKRLCPTSGKRFFDLNKNPVVSPYTGEVVNLDNNGKSRVAIVQKTEKPPEEELELVDDADAVLETEDDTDDADVDLDDDLLEDDEDDTVPLDEIADVATTEDDS